MASLLTKRGHITVKPFAKVPALGDLPEIQPARATVTGVSSRCGVEGIIDPTEGCIVTKTIKYTHQLVHWVNPVRSGDPKDVEKVIEDELGIIPFRRFKLDDPSNLAFLESFLHTSLDLYAFIAVTPSSSTLDDLITMVKSDNSRRQTSLAKDVFPDVEVDKTGCDYRRSLDFSIPSFVTPEYELIALHPEHFLPPGNVLAVCDPTTNICKTYVVARDRVLRESSEPSSPRFPPFHHVPESRNASDHLNVFLVALNAEIKFRRYFRMTQLNPPTVPLPDDVLNIMSRTMELMELLYWEPVPTKGSLGEKNSTERAALRQRNLVQGARPDPTGTIERSSSQEMDVSEDVQSSHRVATGRLPWPKDADLETRMAIGRALMSGHDREYDPELFEDAYPLSGTDPHLYDDEAIVETWRGASGVISRGASKGALGA